ncbi:PREDICTED: structural maintenance of chromosomes protein 6-like [Nanorana parkeri]|uniref:structural maintenance of chromosomes protein 6-like n=1 Tax=Nanorana parkeri TaxID=125878 RepID=UPI00085404A7|nr:PREDICTED: structural maintenance of chromosomes protein 6-like [Nanorana parkeri]
MHARSTRGLARLLRWVDGDERAPAAVDLLLLLVPVPGVCFLPLHLDVQTYILTPKDFRQTDHVFVISVGAGKGNKASSRAIAAWMVKVSSMAYKTKGLAVPGGIMAHSKHSGKSAVVTALIVGLGGKAATMNGGSSIKEFVKEGQTSADISIRLRNRGSDAFRPEVYGDSIVVQQHLTVDGGRTYKLKSKTGSIVSSKKEELVSILDHFNIQIDNPVSILTPEMSKLLMHSKNKSDLYKFFMKATQLEQMKGKYSYIMETKISRDNQVTFDKERLQELKQDYIRNEDRLKDLASLGERKKKLEDLSRSMAWAVVIELEKQLNPVREQIAAEEGRTVNFEQIINEWQEKVSSADENFRAIQEKLEEISQEAQALKPQCIALKDDVQQKKKSYHESEVVFNRHMMGLRQLERDAQQLQMRIEELKNSTDNTSDEEKRLRQIQLQKHKVKELHAQEVTTTEQMGQFQQAIYRDKEERSKLLNEERDLKHQIERLKRQIKEFQDSRTDRLRRFGPNMPSLLAAIDDAYRQGRFKEKPIGPLGACIRLKDPQLDLAVESCLKSLLLAFCCDNHQDERTLQNLMSREFQHGQRPSIIVNGFRDRMYDVSQRAVCHPLYPTVLTAIEIDNPVAANCLIDMRGIETVLLIKNNSEARDVMQRRQPPRNCREAFTADGDQVFKNYSSDFNRARYLSRDVEMEIGHLEGEIGNLASQLSTVHQRGFFLDNDIRKNEDVLRLHHDTKKRIQGQLREANARIADLESVEEQTSIDISTLESELQENKSQNEHDRLEMAKERERMEHFRSLLLNSEGQYVEIKIKINSVSEWKDPVKEALHEVELEVGYCKRHKKHYEEKLRLHLEAIKKSKHELRTKESDLEDKISHAKQINPERIEVTPSAKSLDAEIKTLKAKINSERDLHGNGEEIIKKYLASKEKYQEMRIKVKYLKKFVKLLEDIMTQRYKMYQKFLRYLSLRCKFYFDSLLSQRSYSGKISFDHKNETLSITVQPGEGNKASITDMRSLSEGERSFSSVCFLLSLWSIAESPFQCLDEFDAHMDMVNRRISMDMILTMADSQQYRQFILLTPQHMSSLPSSNRIRILRLQDPERGQTTLPFVPRNQEDEETED